MKVLVIYLCKTPLIFLHKNPMKRRQTKDYKMTKIKKCFWFRDILIFAFASGPAYFNGSLNTVGLIKEIFFWSVIDSYIRNDQSFYGYTLIYRHFFLICKLYFNRDPQPWSCLPPRDTHPWISVRWWWRSTNPIFPLGCGRTRTYRGLSPYRRR